MSEDEAFNAVVHLLLDENTAEGVRDILRAYGDAREQEGLERAAKECLSNASDVEDADEECVDLALRIRALPVPAPNTGGAKVESEVRE